MVYPTLTILVAFVVSGCAVGVQHQYDAVEIDTEIFTERTISVGVLDSRTEVVSGEKKSTWVGYSRGGYYNAFDVTTLSGEPLATDMRNSIVAVLRESGAYVNPSELPAGIPVTQAKNMLLETGGERNLLLVISEWWSNSYFSTTLHYSASMTVFDQTGDVLGATLIQGVDDLGDSGLNIGRDTVPIAYARLLSNMLSHNIVTEALK